MVQPGPAGEEAPVVRRRRRAALGRPDARPPAVTRASRSPMSSRRSAATRPITVVDLVFPLDDGPHVYVERVEINGNTRTEDRVIRREFSFAEGDPYTDNVREAHQAVARGPRLLPDGQHQTRRPARRRTGRSSTSTCQRKGHRRADARRRLLDRCGPARQRGPAPEELHRHRHRCGHLGHDRRIREPGRPLGQRPVFPRPQPGHGVDIFRSPPNYSALGYADYNEVREGGTLPPRLRLQQLHLAVLELLASSTAR